MAKKKKHVETEGFEPPTFYRLVLNEQCKANVIPLHHIPFVEIRKCIMRYIMLLRAKVFSGRKCWSCSFAYPRKR